MKQIDLIEKIGDRKPASEDFGGALPRLMNWKVYKIKFKYNTYESCTSKKLFDLL